MIKVLSFLLPIITAVPQLVTVVEGLFTAPKAGSSKWISVETALSQSIQQVADEIAKSVPDAKADEVAAKVAVWAKAVNDSTVGLFNEVGLFQPSK